MGRPTELLAPGLKLNGLVCTTVTGRWVNVRLWGAACRVIEEVAQRLFVFPAYRARTEITPVPDLASMTFPLIVALLVPSSPRVKISMTSYSKPSVGVAPGFPPAKSSNCRYHSTRLKVPPGERSPISRSHVPVQMLPPRALRLLPEPPSREAG